ncbi:MAG TPA: DUF2905 domain-containing protein [Casimicrobiaceae bacterium]|jgi:uncharacterized protein HemY|nr:DUF2905 domain-containing protein [Casimicrobiaceae bacterium]
MQRVLIVVGLLILAVGIAWPWIARLGLGRLPGDINVERDGWSFHFPIVTSIVISVVLTFLLWLFRK